MHFIYTEKYILKNNTRSVKMISKIINYMKEIRGGVTGNCYGLLYGMILLRG